MEKLDAFVDIARNSNGPTLADDYSRGMINGLILAQAIINGTDPEYVHVQGMPSDPQVELQRRIDDATAA